MRRPAYIPFLTNSGAGVSKKLKWALGSFAHWNFRSIYDSSRYCNLDGCERGPDIQRRWVPHHTVERHYFGGREIKSEEPGGVSGALQVLLVPDLRLRPPQRI